MVSKVENGIAKVQRWQREKMRLLERRLRVLNRADHCLEECLRMPVN